MTTPISRFRNIHLGETIFVIGSGYSLTWFKNIRFKNCSVIGVNRIARWFPVNYVIVHHHDSIDEIIQNGNYECLFVSRWDQCVISGKEKKHPEDKYFVYDHLDQGYQHTDFRPLFPEFQAQNPNCILTGGNTVINAIGLAYFMGARNIILIGCDAGSINGNSNLSGYHPENEESKIYQTGHACRSLALNMELRARLWDFGVNLWALNPFLDYNLEGNNFFGIYPTPGEEFFYELYEKHRLK